MPREPRRDNPIDTVAVTIRTTEQVVGALDALLRTGFFGKSRAETAEELLRAKVLEETARLEAGKAKGSLEKRDSRGRTD